MLEVAVVHVDAAITVTEHAGVVITADVHAVALKTEVADVLAVATEDGAAVEVVMLKSHVFKVFQALRADVAKRISWKVRPF